MQPPQTSSTDAQIAPVPPPAPPMAAPRTTESTYIPSANPTGKQTASIVALVAGLMFFVPLVAQAIGIVAGLYALSRPRDSGARKGLAGVGLALSLAALAGWVLLFSMIPGSFFGSSATTGVPFGVFPNSGELSTMEDDPHGTDTWREFTSKVQKAAVAYRRDYGRWPASVEVMRGRTLPPGFSLPEPISYRPVPASHAENLKWILLVSEPTFWNLDAEKLSRPHRLIQQVNGSIALLPAEVVAQRLALDDAGLAIPPREAEATEPDEP